MDKVVITDKTAEDRLNKGDLLVNFKRQKIDFIAEIVWVDKRAKNPNGQPDVVYRYKVLVGYHPMWGTVASGYSPMVHYSYKLFHTTGRIDWHPEIKDGTVEAEQRMVMKWLFTRTN